MEEEVVKKVKCMWDFSNLFFSIYTIENIDEEGKLYFPNNFKELLKFVFIIDENLELLKKFNVLNNKEKFDMNEFLSKFKLSTVKKYWRSEFMYDFDKDCIVIDGSLKNATEVYKTFDDESKNMVKNIVSQIEYLKNNENYCVTKKLVKSDD